MDKKYEILVAGGAGFIGANLCTLLIKEGHFVTILDNLYTGRLENLDHLEPKKFKFVNRDIRTLNLHHKYSGMEEFEWTGDIIINLACPASPNHYQKDAVFTLETSVIGSLELIELANRTGARYIFTSTSEVYGDPDVHPQPEEYLGNVNPIGPRACYDEGKRAAETMVANAYYRHGLDVTIVRVFNTYGPLMAVNDGRVVSNFIIQALSGEDLTIFGDGSQTRSFCYVDDMIEAIYLLALKKEKGNVMSPGENKTDHGSRDLGPYNLGNPAEFTINELATKVLDKIKGPSKIIFKDLPADDPKLRCPDISKFQEKYEWHPNIPLEVGLEHSIKYFKSILNK
jgi:UDP-glucuronate decarboxylase